MPQIVGTSGPDSLVGTSEPEWIRGGDNADVIDGGPGADTIDGGPGADTIYGGLGPDLILLGPDDTLILRPGNPEAFPDFIDTVVGWSPSTRIAFEFPVTPHLVTGYAATFADAVSFADLNLAREPTFGGMVFVAVEVGSDVLVFTSRNPPYLPHATYALRISGIHLGEVHSTNFVPAQIVEAGFTYTGTPDRDVVGGSVGNDTILGMDGNDVLGGSDSRLGSSAGADLLSGGAGDDNIEQATAGDTLLGGDGNDFLTVRIDPSMVAVSASSVYALQNPGVHFATTTTSYLDGGSGDDVIEVGTTSNVTLDSSGPAHAIDAVVMGGAGNDFISLGGDIGGSIDGGAGDDGITVGEASQIRLAAPVVTLGPGADRLAVIVQFSRGDATVVVTDYHPAEGDSFIVAMRPAVVLPNQRLVQQGADSVLQVDLDGPTGPQPYTDIIRFLNVRASDIDPRLATTLPAANTTPTAGDDSLMAASDRSELHAGAGQDTIVAGSEYTYLRGDEGNDSIRGGSLFDDVNGNMGDDTLDGGLGDDWVVGGKDNDSISGGYGNDLVYGNLGDDTLKGGPGADIVRGGQGNDTLDGGSGDDFVSGDRGDDTVFGGSGYDTFHGSQDAGIDRIMDFRPGEDVIRLDPGTSYILRQVGEDVVVDMGNGNEILFRGSLSSLPDGWIFSG